jgi:GRAM domain-containing protein 4
MLLFTPIMSMEAKISIPFRDIVAAKKVGVLKGLFVRWRRGGDGSETQEKFTWIGGRDELFARLVGAENRRWLKA